MVSESSTAKSASKKAPKRLHVAPSLQQVTECDHMLVYLTDLTWTRDEETALFVDEVAQVRPSIT